MPIRIYRGSENAKEEVRSLPLTRVLNRSANPEMTAMECRSQLLMEMLLQGNSFARSIRNKGGQVIELWPIKPERVFVRRVLGGPLIYTVTVNQTSTEYSMDEIFHLREATTYGVLGASPLKILRDAIGLTVAAQTYASRFFAQGGRPSGVLVHPSTFGTGKDRKQKFEEFRQNWDAIYGGVQNSNKTAILEEGMEYKPITLTPEEAQLIQSRTFQLAEVARIFRLPPHLLYDLSRSTNNNIEAQGQEFLNYSLGSRIERFEQRVQHHLLGDEPDLFVRHDPSVLMRADTASRTNYLRARWQTGSMSANEIRAVEGENGIGPDGDKYYVPVNMVPLGTPPAVKPTPGEPGGTMGGLGGSEGKE